MALLSHLHTTPHTTPHHHVSSHRMPPTTLSSQRGAPSHAAERAAENPYQGIDRWDNNKAPQSKVVTGGA